MSVQAELAARVKLQPCLLIYIIDSGCHVPAAFDKSIEHIIQLTLRECVAGIFLISDVLDYPVLTLDLVASCLVQVLGFNFPHLRYSVNDYIVLFSLTFHL